MIGWFRRTPAASLVVVRLPSAAELAGQPELAAVVELRDGARVASVTRGGFVIFAMPPFVAHADGEKASPLAQLDLEALGWVVAETAENGAQRLARPPS